jgi:hemolysin III
VLIAGTYTPFMLVALQGQAKGVVIATVVWVAALLGIMLNAISVSRFAKLSLVLYLLMGWCIVFAIGDVAAALSTGGLVLLFVGGAGYTIGVAFYLAKKVRYMHAVWHLFVLLGSVLHYLCIVLYVIPRG